MNFTRVSFCFSHPPRLLSNCGCTMLLPMRLATRLPLLSRTRTNLLGVRSLQHAHDGSDSDDTRAHHDGSAPDVHEWGPKGDNLSPFHTFHLPKDATPEDLEKEVARLSWRPPLTPGSRYWGRSCLRCGAVQLYGKRYGSNKYPGYSSASKDECKPDEHPREEKE